MAPYGIIGAYLSVLSPIAPSLAAVPWEEITRELWMWEGTSGDPLVQPPFFHFTFNKLKAHHYLKTI